MKIENYNSSGAGMFNLISDLYPICRSITGDGVRETLRIVQGMVPLEITEVPTGTKVFDWEIPREWNIRDAYIQNLKGEKIIDFHTLNLHVLNYSSPVNETVSLEELKKHLYTIPEMPDLVPYRTSYYAEKWGFCMSHNQMESLKDEKYKVVVDSSLSKGNLTYGEVYIKGKVPDEILFSTHICHPSLCNDNLTGIAVCANLARYVSRMDNYYSYRFLFVPGTIGAIAWLALNEEKLHLIRYGLVTSLLGLDDVFTFKRTRTGNTTIDQIVEHVIEKETTNPEIIDFIPYGYDERQYCSPGINLNMGNLTRVPYAQYPEYHTSADNMDLISQTAIEDSLSIFIKILKLVEQDKKYLNLFPKGEPQLGKRGLYDDIGGHNDSKTIQMAMLWILNFSDGIHTISDIAIRSGIDIDIMAETTEMLLNKGLLKQL